MVSAVVLLCLTPKRFEGIPGRVLGFPPIPMGGLPVLYSFRNPPFSSLDPT